MKLLCRACPLLLISLSAWGLTNITVDDTSNMIKYKGSWDDSSSHTSSLDFGGSHTLSSDSSASATFTFTGVAVCVLYPLWPYPVSVMITVDGGVETILNLTDPIASPTASGGSESSQSDVRWCTAGLSNSSHEAVVSMAPSGNWVVVDGFIYTVDNSYESATSSIASHASATATGSSGVNSNGPEDTVLAIALGASVSVAILLTAILFFFFRCRRRRSTFISVTDNSIPLDNISLTPYVAPSHPQRTTKDTSSGHISPAPPFEPEPPTPPPKLYMHSLRSANPDENTPLNCDHNLTSSAAGGDTVSTPSEQSRAGDKMAPPPYSGH